MSLRKSFEAANEAHLKYVVLNDNRQLPEMIPHTDGQIRILVEADSRGRFITLFGLKPNHPTLRDKCELYTHPESRIPIRLITKGRGYFPETFETAILATLHVSNRCVPSVGSSSLLYVVLYEYLFHGVQINDRINCVFMDALRQRGLGKSVYKNPHRSIRNRKQRIEDTRPEDIQPQAAQGEKVKANA